MEIRDSRRAVACALLVTTALARSPVPASAPKPGRRGQIKVISAAAISGLVGLLAAPATAQVGPGLTPPPVFETIDGNGVDVESGKVVLGIQSISIGPGGPGSLSFEWSTDSGQMNSIGGYAILSSGATTDTASVTINGSSESFSSPHGTYNFTQDQGRPSTLIYNSATDIYTYTAADGSTAVFSKNLVAGSPASSTYGLVSLTYPAGQVLTYYYTYRASSYYDLRVITSSLGYQLRFTRDTNGNINSAVAFNMYNETCDPQAATCTLVGTWPKLTWDSASSSIIDASNLSVRWTQSGTQMQLVYPSGRTLTWNGSLNGSGKFIVNNFTDGKGTWRYNFAPNPAGGTTTIFNPDNAAPRAVSFLSSGLVTDDRPLGSSTETHYTYDSKNRTTDVSWTDGTLTTKKHYGYDARGNLNEVRQVSITPGSPADIVSTASYDSSCSNPKTCNQPNYVIDPAGNQTDYTYDPNSGGVATITQPAPASGAVRPQTRYSYSQLSANYRNGSGQIVAGPPLYKLTALSECQTLAICTGTADEVKTTVSYSSNDALLPISTSTGDGTGALTATSTMTYTVNGDVNTVDGPLPGTGDTSRNYYDVMRRPLGSIGPAPGNGQPNRATRIAYDADGRAATADVGTAIGQGDNDLANMTSLQQQVTSYDPQGRVSILRANAGGTTYSLTQRSYTSGGQLYCQTVRMNPATFASPPSDACTLGTQGNFGPDQITQFAYDGFFHVTSITTGVATPSVAVDVTNGYDSLGRVQTVKDANNNVTTYKYDGMNRLQSTCYADSGADCEVLTYDQNGNIYSLQLRSGDVLNYRYDALNRMILKSSPVLSDVTYTHDNLGRLLSLANGSGQIAFKYDALGRPLSESGPQGTVCSMWDLGGRRTLLRYPGSSDCSVMSPLYLNYDYLVTGEVQKIRENGATSGVGVLASYGYDSLGNRQSVTYGNNVTLTYGYDPVSRLQTLTANLAGTANDLTHSFTYSPASQITSVTRSNDAYAFPTAQLGNVNRGYTPNVLNQYAAAGATSFSYDGRGNLTQSGSTYYCYDVENRLTNSAAISGCQAPTVSLGYDAAGRLLSLTANGAMTSFAYDGVNLIAEYNGSALKSRYVFGSDADEPIVSYDASGNRNWLVSDERGSIVASTDAGGNMTGILSYDEYGIPASSNSGRFQYTGQVYLPELGMYYYKLRMYSTTLGRFMQTDPVGYDDGMNWYTYTHNDPINGADSLGLGCEGIGNATCTPDGAIGGPYAGSPYNYSNNAPYYCQNGACGQYQGSPGSSPSWVPQFNLPDLYQSAAYQPDIGAAANSIVVTSHRIRQFFKGFVSPDPCNAAETPRSGPRVNYDLDTGPESAFAKTLEAKFARHTNGRAGISQFAPGITPLQVEGYVMLAIQGSPEVVGKQPGRLALRYVYDTGGIVGTDRVLGDTRYLTVGVSVFGSQGRLDTLYVGCKQ